MAPGVCDRPSPVWPADGEPVQNAEREKFLREPLGHVEPHEHLP